MNLRITIMSDFNAAMTPLSSRKKRGQGCPRSDKKQGCAHGVGAPFETLLRLRLFVLRFVSSVECMLQGYQVFAGLERVERGLLSLQLLLRIVRGLDREADAPIALVDLDDTR